MIKRIQLLLAVTLIAALLMVGCRPAAEPTEVPEPTKAAAEPTKAPEPTDTPIPAGPTVGGTAVHGSHEEPDRIWGPITGLTVSSEISRLVNASLVQVNDRLDFIPDLALEVPTLENGGISSDGLSYTFKLRQSVKWHDDTPFTSKDVKFTWEVVMMEGVDVRGRVGWDRIEEVETPDDYTVIYRLKEVYAPFVSHVGVAGILPEHILGGLTAEEINNHPWFRAPVGLGPYKFVEWVQGSHLKMVRNPDYFREGKPYIETIIFRIVPDANALVNMIETGEVQTDWRINDELVPVLDALPDVQVVRSKALPPELLWMNHTRFPFDDKQVRQALAYGFDKEALCSKIFKGMVEPAWGLVSPLSWAYNPNLPKHEYDPDKAAQILADAGWKKGADDILEKDGEKLSFELLLIEGEADIAQAVSFIQQQWLELGIDAQIRVVDVGQMWGKALPTRDYQMAVSYVGRPIDPDMAPLYLSPEHNPPINFAGYANPEVDDLLSKALQTVDQEKRKEYYFKVQEIVADDVVYLFLFWRSSHSAISTKLQGYKSSPSFTEFWNVYDWWLED
jgi:peptide/nickel transport system substrate-binding protein